MLGFLASLVVGDWQDNYLWDLHCRVREVQEQMIALSLVNMCSVLFYGLFSSVGFTPHIINIWLSLNCARLGLVPVTQRQIVN